MRRPSSGTGVKANTGGEELDSRSQQLLRRMEGRHAENEL